MLHLIYIIIENKYVRVCLFVIDSSKTQFLAAMSSSRSDDVTKSVCVCVCVCVCVFAVIFLVCSIQCISSKIRVLMVFQDSLKGFLKFQGSFMAVPRKF